MHELANQLLSSLKATWQYKWYALAIAWIIALLGWSYVYKMPNRYEAFARIHVDTDSILRPLMAGLAVQPNLNQKIEMISQTLISRPNLEKLIRMADLDIGLKTDGQRSQLINHLRTELTIKGTGKQNLFTISFADEDPEVAKRVVESLLTLFVDSNRNDKGEDSDLARRFIDEQLEGYRIKLEEAEGAIIAFKRRYLGLMPGEGQGYFAKLMATKDLLRQAELDLEEAEKSASTIKKQLSLESQNLPLQDDGNVIDMGIPQTDIEVRIGQLEQRLDDLRLQYTEQHPDIVALRPMIAKLKARNEIEQRLLHAKQEAEAKRRAPMLTTAQATNPVYQQLAVSLTTAEANLAAINARVAEYRRRYAELQASANAIPQVEAEFTQLTRDYQGYKVRYDELLGRREKAQITESMEESNVTMGFRVIDPPRIPSAPSSPNRLKLITMVLLAAIGGGGGFAFGMSQLRPTINDEKGLREVGGLPVLGTIIMTWTDAQKSRRKWGFVAFLTSFASLLSAYIAIVVMIILAMARA